jgi:signal transduction histidine kinase
LERRLMLWAVVLLVAPTFLCAVSLNRIAMHQFSQNHVRTAELLTQTLAGALSGQLANEWSMQADGVIDGLAYDPRVALIIVSDADNHVLHQRVLDPEAYTAFATMADRFDGSSIDPADPVTMQDGGELVARKMPVWGQSTVAHVADRRDLQGFVLLGMREKAMPAVLWHLRTAQLQATALICLAALPLVLIAVRRWAAPLRSLLCATAALTSGDRPTPVPEGARDELGLLARRFNIMTDRLLDARQALELANEQLEEKVQLRTSELVTVNARLETEIRDKDEFLRAVTHDLGAPLRNINGMASMLLLKYKEALADDALNKLQRISANAKLQTELIGELLELSKIRTRPGRREVVDLGELVRDLCASMSYDLERSEIDLRIDEPLPVIYAERNRIRQVFQNLLENAVKYMLDAKQRRITVTCTQDDQQYTFSVSDTGHGIAEQDLPHVFQVFRRATHSGTHTVPGRGVGLASVKSILETYGGQLSVQSKLGEGSTFRFTIPRARVALPGCVLTR